MSKVYFASAKADGKKDSNLLNKLSRLYDALGYAKALAPRDFVAVKTHFGEEGNNTFIRPLYLARLVERLKESGAQCFLTDTNTFYIDHRHNAVVHLKTAMRHGFYPPSLDAPTIIADGLTGGDYVKVPIKGKHFKEVKVASVIKRANGLLVASHFKGHVIAGFGGALKNLGVGCAARRGKLEIHNAKTKVNGDCNGCGACVPVCPSGAMKMLNGKASPDASKCVSCGACNTACSYDAVEPDWATQPSREFMEERIVEYAWGAVKGKEAKTAFINFMLDVTPECDCEPWSDPPIVHDIGVAASWDPVALDQACADFVNAQDGNRGSALKSGLEKGGNKFRALNSVDWTVQLAHAEMLGLGSRRYELVEVA